MSHYISNKEFTAAIVEYINDCNLRESRCEVIKEIPRAIAEQFIALATKLGSRYNFSGYTFRDEMVASAIFACCAKIRKFNPEIGSNAFAYFTNVCWRAMVDVINEEEKNSYIKAKSFGNVDYSDQLSDNDISEYSEYSGNMTDYIPFFDVADYERKMQERKERAKESPKKQKNSAPVLEVD